jgi:hypothetical protein
MLQEAADNIQDEEAANINQLVSSPWSIIEEEAPEDEEMCIH